MSGYIKTPWAESGDKSIPPETPQGDGSVSLEKGWTDDYERSLDSDPRAKGVERRVMNAALNRTDNAVKTLQTHAGEIWSADATYAQGAIVTLAGVAYTSVIDGNTHPVTDSLAWQPYIHIAATQAEADAGAPFERIITPPVLKETAGHIETSVKKAVEANLLPIGAIILWGSVTPPAGWIELNGQAFDPVKNPKLAVLYPSGRVPDWRGRFVRAWAHGSAVDPDANRGILSVQSDEIAEHSHLITLGHNGDGGNGRDEGEPYMRLPTKPFRYTIATENKGGAETRPKNVAAMYIIKTDTADVIAAEDTPYAITVTPDTAQSVIVGGSINFAGHVDPVALAGKYPVTWHSSNPAIGTIDAGGHFIAIAAGEVDVVASISTGMQSARRVHVSSVLTALAMDALPAMKVGDAATGSHVAVLHKTPPGATETVTWTSSAPAVASVSADGRVSAASAGTAIITATGALSGIVASQQVHVSVADAAPAALMLRQTAQKLINPSAFSSGTPTDASYLAGKGWLVGENMGGEIHHGVIHGIYQIMELGAHPTGGNFIGRIDRVYAHYLQVSTDGGVTWRYVNE